MIRLEGKECFNDEKATRICCLLINRIWTYFLIRQLDLQLFANFYSWPTFLLIVGIAYLIHGFTIKNEDDIFIGVILTGLGIHFHGIENYRFWFDHWSIFALIFGLAYMIRFWRTKKGFIPGVILLTIAFFMIFSVSLPSWFTWIYGVVEFLETFWPVALIAIGLYLLKFKK